MGSIISQRIRELRIANGFKSQESLAESLGVSLKTVQKWENDSEESNITLNNLLKMCSEFKCDLDFLVGRIKQPTHDIEFIQQRTGLSIDAIKKLLNQKAVIEDSPLSEIIEHSNLSRLLRVLALASNEDEIAWLDLDKIPSELSSAYTNNPIDIAGGVGCDVAEYLATQELTTILRGIRQTREKKKRTQKQAELAHQYNIYSAKEHRKTALKLLEEDIDFYTRELDFPEVEHSEAEILRMKKKITNLYDLRKRIQNASFAEWERGLLEKEVDDLVGR